MFEAVEALAATRLRAAPHACIVVSGHDEEAGGRAPRAAAQLLQSRGVRAEFVLDEGLAVVADFPLLGRPVALVGVAEKGYATLKVTAPAKGGHSSAPPPETGVEVLAKAVLGDHRSRSRCASTAPAADMVRALAPDAGLAVRMAVANEWLFAPLLVRRLPRRRPVPRPCTRRSRRRCCAAARRRTCCRRTRRRGSTTASRRARPPTR